MEDASIRVNPDGSARSGLLRSLGSSAHRDTAEDFCGRSACLLENAPGVVVMDERRTGGYPTPATDSAGRDPVYVGRIREDLSHVMGLNLWVVSDNIRKGAALNSVQIAEILIEKYLA